MSVGQVPPVLREEAGGAREVEATGATVRELLEDLAHRCRRSASGSTTAAEIRRT